MQIHTQKPLIPVQKLVQGASNGPSTMMVGTNCPSCWWTSARAISTRIWMIRDQRCEGNSSKYCSGKFRCMIKTEKDAMVIAVVDQSSL